MEKYYKKKIKKSEKIVCIGDLHGGLQQIKSLWKNLEKELGTELKKTIVIFLGDYCDKGGMETKQLIDWLIKLKKSRGKKMTRFLCGNHDFSFACFLGRKTIPTDPKTLPPDLDTTIPKHIKPNRYIKYKIKGGMHFQGRRWGHYKSKYRSANTFISYGIKKGNITNKLQIRQQLIDNVPNSHKKFLRELEWVIMLKTKFPPYKIICVHAGLIPDRPAKIQLKALKKRDIGDKNIQLEYGRIHPICGRDKAMHPDLVNKSILISGHFGYNEINKDRIIIDNCGKKGCEPDAVLNAIILPERKIISS